MSYLSETLAHHSEAVDPTLIEWIRHQIDRITGLDSGSIVLILGILIVLFPVGLLTLAWRRRRQFDSRSPQGSGEIDRAD